MLVALGVALFAILLLYIAARQGGRQEERAMERDAMAEDAAKAKASDTVVDKLSDAAVADKLRDKWTRD